MDKLISERLGLRRAREISRHNGLFEYEAIGKDTKDKWRIWGANKKAQGKLLKWYDAVSSLVTGDCGYLKKTDAPSGVWIAQRCSHGEPVASVTSSSTWRLGEVLSLTLQFANALKSLDEREIVVNSNCFEDMRVSTSDHEFPRLIFTGLSPIASETLEAHSTAHVAGRFLYALLTGHIPPTEEQALEDTVEGERLTGFDSLLVDWVEEHQFPSGLGGLALQAYKNEMSLKAFTEALFPYFEKEVNALTLGLENESADLDDAVRDLKTSGARVQELEALIEVHETWLQSKCESIEAAEGRVARVEHTLRQIEVLEHEITGQMGVDSTINYQLSDSSASQAMPEDESSIDGELARAEPSTIELDPNQFWPDDPKLNGNDRAEQVSSVHKHVPVERTQRSASNVPNGAMSPFHLGIGVGFALCLLLWGLMDFGSDPEQSSPAVLPLAIEQPSAPKNVVPIDSGDLSPSLAERVALDGSDAARQPSSISSDAEVADITSIRDLSVKTIEKSQQPTPLSDSGVQGNELAVVERVASLPVGMVRLERGFLHQGLTDSQRRLLFDACAQIFGLANHRCLKIKSEPQLTNTGIELAPFGLDLTEVDYADYVQCVQENRCPKPSHQWNKVRFPVTGVSSTAAQSFCAWKGKRLPTELEWMFAVRTSGGERVFPWGNGLPSKKRANLGRWDKTRITDARDGHRYVAPVNSFRKGETSNGLLNMVGNVKEIVTVQGESGRFVAKGAGYLSLGFEARVTAREPLTLKTNSTDLGFRCALSL
ncbi:MAG: formylglycine-generating enzyme family protein [Bradymonadia bacterium]